MAELRFYTDENTAVEIARQLRRDDVDIVTCQEAGLLGESDDVQLAYATAEGRIMITCDQDFLRMDAVYWEASQQHGGIIFLGPDACKNIGRAVRELRALIQQVDSGTIDVEKHIQNAIRYIY